MDRRPRTARAVATIGVMILVATTAAALAPSAGARAPAVLRPAHELAILTTSHLVMDSPDSRAPVRPRRVLAWRHITRGPTVLPVIGRATSGGIDWLRVRIPGRPNGSTGWIAKQDTLRATTSWQIVVRRGARQLLVYRHGRLIRRFAASVGKQSTPTPLGAFFVEESVRMPRGSAGAPFALALSARSDVLERFEGGSGQIAIHGMAKLAGSIGTATSHGCVRLAGPSIRWLAARIPAGAPVTVVP